MLEELDLKNKTAHPPLPPGLSVPGPKEASLTSSIGNSLLLSFSSHRCSLTSSSGESFLKPPCNENVWVPSLHSHWKSWNKLHHTFPGFNEVPWNHNSKAKDGSTPWNPPSVTTPWISFGCDVPGWNPPVQLLSPQQGPNIPSVPPHFPTYTLTSTSTGTAYKNRTQVSIFRIKCFNVSARAGVKSSFWIRQYETQNMLNSLLLQGCTYPSWPKDNIRKSVTILENS